MLLSYFWFYNGQNLFFKKKKSCVLWVKAAKTSAWPGLVQKLVQTLFNSVLFSLFLSFFKKKIKCLLSVMNVFISGSALTCSELLLNVWDWGGGRTLFFFLFCFVFKGFKAENQKDTNISINHDLWSCLFCGKPDFFFNSIKGLWHLISSQLHLMVCRVFVSLNFLLLWGFFVFFFFFAEWLHTREVELYALVCVCGCRQDAVDLPAQTGGYCIFSSGLILGVATLPLLCRTPTHQKTCT